MTYCNKYQTKGYTIICGDFNARCGSNTDYIEGVDDIKPRTTIDTTENYNGDLFCEFLSDTNFAMLNGRIGINDFTYISPRGRSVVDYICVPYEQLESVLDFKIMRMSDIINTLNYNPESIPDHSLLSCDIKYPVNVDEISNHYANEVKIKRNARKIPDDFLISDEVRHKVLDTIEKIEHSVYLDQNVQNAYDEFHKLIMNEMETKLPLLQQKNINKRSKSFYKPYWNQTLQTQWTLSCECEKKWLKFKGPPHKKKLLKENYCTERNIFDKINRKFKRKYQIQKENELHEKLKSTNKREFWKSIGKLGIANERKIQIPWEVVDSDGNINTGEKIVLKKWKSDFETLFSNKLNVTTPEYSAENDQMDLSNLNLFKHPAQPNRHPDCLVERLKNYFKDAKIMTHISCTSDD
ncbi:unnamed protein product [Mytilus coruscus]|uniref:Endonuclease/exonuclease/phosphatase domain-containing protein n=1 Tax=Mytilus coruscus TaxID=42192 RepID=A0A6J8BJY2_MYTCO|nr:unnamed protein product [Mytilus coruscus]